MAGNGTWADGEGLGDLRVGETLPYQQQHLVFMSAQPEAFPDTILHGPLTTRQLLGPDRGSRLHLRDHLLDRKPATPREQGFEPRRTQLLTGHSHGFLMISRFMMLQGDR